MLRFSRSRSCSSKGNPLEVFNSNFHQRWGLANGVLFDSRYLEFRQVPYGGFGLFTKPSFVDGARYVEPGEMLVVVPSDLTVQSTSLAPSVRAEVELLARSLGIDSEETEWWCLTVALAVEKLKSASCEGNSSVAHSSSKFQGYLNYSLPQDHILRRPGDVFAQFGHQLKDPHRLEVLLTQQSKYIKELSQLCKELNSSGGNTSLHLPEGVSVPSTRSSSDFSSSHEICSTWESLIEWSYLMVKSRANNFSFDGSTAKLRPYGLFDSPLPEGAQPTMCPYFDTLNHTTNKTTGTNVLVADCVMEIPKRRRRNVHGGPSSDQEGGQGSTTEDQEMETENTTCLVIGSLTGIPPSTELCYRYNAPRTRRHGGSNNGDDGNGGETIDIEASIARWGFIPE